MRTKYPRPSSIKLSAAVAAGFLSTLLLVSIAVNAAPSMVEYATSVPFVSHQVPPNILLIVDNSGSMNTIATFFPPKAFSPSATFFGYFESAKCYQYDGTKFVTTTTANKASGVCTSTPNYEWDGSLLNYVSMRRRDVARWVLTGGTCENGRAAAPADGSCPTKILRGVDFANNHSETVQISSTDATGRMPQRFTDPSVPIYFNSMGSIASMAGTFCVNDYYANILGSAPTGVPVSACTEVHNNAAYPNEGFAVRVQSLAEPTGVIQQVGIRARLGLMFYNKEEGGQVAANVGDNASGVGVLLNKIETDNGSHWTVLAESLYEAVRYFAQVQPYAPYDTSILNDDKVGPDYNVGPAADPYHFNPPSWTATDQDAACCNSHIIMFTDGEPTHDENIPAAIKNMTSPPAPGPVFADFDVAGNLQDDYLPNVAYWAHTVDLRPDNGSADPKKACDPSAGAIPNVALLNEPGKCLPGKQSLTIYTFFMYGPVSGSDILKKTAIYGGFKDLNKDGLFNPGEEDLVNNVSGVSIPDGQPDTYFESSNAQAMRDRFLNIFNSITSETTSAAVTAVVASSSSGEGATYQAYFYPEYAPTTAEIGRGMKEIRWLGYTQALFVDAFGHLREDTNGDGKLTYEIDDIIVPFYDTSATPNRFRLNVFHDGNGDGIAGDPLVSGSEAVQDIIELGAVKPIWEAGRQLALTDSTARKIWTWVDSNNDGRVDSGSEFIPFNLANSGTLAPYLRASAAPFDANNIVKFVRGFQDDALGLRDRRKLVDGQPQIWKLGDIVNSSPVVVAGPRERHDIIYGDTTYVPYFQRYIDRRQVVYVGGNDGMLHAFNAGFYMPGDDPSTSELEHGRFSKAPPAGAVTKFGVTNSPALGAELWGFVPYQLLPHLQWHRPRLYPRRLCGSSAEDHGCADFLLSRRPLDMLAGPGRCRASERMGHHSDRRDAVRRKLCRLSERNGRRAHDYYGL